MEVPWLTIRPLTFLTLPSLVWLIAPVLRTALTFKRGPLVVGLALIICGGVFSPEIFLMVLLPNGLPNGVVLVGAVGILEVGVEVTVEIA